MSFISKNNLQKWVFVFSLSFGLALVAGMGCLGGNSGPTGGGSGQSLDSSGGGIGAVDGGGGGSVTVSQANPEMDPGIVGPESDYDDIVAKITCNNAKCIQYISPELEPSDYDPKCVFFDVYLGLPFNGFTPCCNNRVVRFVDTWTHQYVDYQTGIHEGVMGGFEMSLSSEGPLPTRVFLAPEDFASGTLEEWQACGNNCIPEGWKEFITPFHDKSCGFIKIMQAERTTPFLDKVDKTKIYEIAPGDKDD